MMEVVVYSASWAGDPALGEALVTVLCDELRRRAIAFKVEEAHTPLEFLNPLGEMGTIPSWGPLREVLVSEELLGSAQEAFEHVLTHRSSEVKERALEISRARGYVQGEEEAKEYLRGLEEGYGFI